MNIPFYPAHSSNFTKGRNRAVRFITIHHTAANNTTLRNLWANPARNASSHYFVSSTRIEQYVKLADTAWCNGNFASNSECITIEVNGNWQGTYYNQKTIDNLTKLLAHIKKIYPTIQLNYHNDIVATICPGTLKSKGYARKAFSNNNQGGNVANITKTTLNQLTMGMGNRPVPNDIVNHWTKQPTSRLNVPIRDIYNSSWAKAFRADAKAAPALRRQVTSLRSEVSELTTRNDKLVRALEICQKNGGSSNEDISYIRTKVDKIWSLLTGIFK